VQDAIQLEFDKIEADVRVHCDNRNRFIVTADEKLTAFLELERRLKVSVHKIKTTHRNGQIAARSRAALEHKVNSES
jgi:hypothetical protein